MIRLSGAAWGGGGGGRKGSQKGRKGTLDYNDGFKDTGVYT